MESNLNVILLRHTPQPLKTVAASAKLCYSSVGASELNDNLDDEASEKFVKMLSSMGHFSPIEHISFTFAIEGVSRALTHQLVRHRLASYSQQSQRYVSEDSFDYILPPKIKENKEAYAEFLSAMENAKNSYAKIRKLLTDEWTKEMIKEGRQEKKAKRDAEKMANEDARFVLPNACETKIIVTMNARELTHFFSNRCCTRAQWEIRELATKMLLLAKEACPIIFDKCGPACIRGACPEGIMSCGEQIKMKEKFLKDR